MNKINKRIRTGINKYGTKNRYYMNGCTACRHSIGRPSIMNAGDGYIMWYVDNVNYVMTVPYCEACGFSGEKIVMWVLKYGHTLPTNASQL